MFDPTAAAAATSLECPAVRLRHRREGLMLVRRDIGWEGRGLLAELGWGSNGHLRPVKEHGTRLGWCPPLTEAYRPTTITSEKRGGWALGRPCR
jgi:hypothetical protein